MEQKEREPTVKKDKKKPRKPGFYEVCEVNNHYVLFTQKKLYRIV